MKGTPVLISVFIVIFLFGNRGAAVSSAEIGTEDATLGIGGDGLIGLHIAELGAAAEERYVAVVNFCSDVALDGFGVVDTATEEVVDIGVIYLPPHVAVDLFERRSCCLVDIAAADVAFSIVVSYCGIGIIGSGEVEAWVFAPRHRHRHVGGGLATVTMGAHTELIDPYIAANVDIDGFTSDGLALC